MPHFVVTADTALSPETIIAALTDFGPLRAQLWPNLDPEAFSVRRLDGAEAEVIEGSRFLGGIWERVRYDWATPGRVRLDVLDGNATRAGSFWEYRIKRLAGHRTEVALEVDRRGRGVKGAVLVVLLSVFGRRVFAADLRKSFEAIAAVKARSEHDTAASRVGATAGEAG